MILVTKPVALAITLLIAPGPEGESGMVARYTFDEGAGTILKNHAGAKHAGTIHNAAWEPSPRGRRLAFNRAGSYVDCGAELGRKLTGDSTLVAWVRLSPSAYPDGSTNWTIADCEDYTQSGFIVRVDGQTAKLYYRASTAGRTGDVFSRAILQKDVFHHVAVTRAGDRVAFYIDGRPDVSITADRPAPPSQSLKISSPGQPLQGVLGRLAFYDRALSRDEILGRYKAEAGDYGKDTSWFGKFQIEPFFYFDRKKAMAAVDCLGVLPVPAGTATAVELARAGAPAIQTLAATSLDESGKQDFTFDLTGLAPGDYEIRAVLRDAQGRTITREAVPFRYPPLPVAVPRPAEMIVSALPESPKPLAFCVETDACGGLLVRAKGREFPVLSEFSYPGGGFNALGRPAGNDRQAEPAWKPTVEQLSPAQYRITAAGKYYRLVRCVAAEPNRVVVRDTITNKTGEPLGILVRNGLGSLAGVSGDRFVAGYRCGGEVIDRPVKTNPTLFVPGRDMGLGLVALDDVFIVQSLATTRGDSAALHTDTFALDKNASYTLEWAVYPTGSDDYYDFINQVRRDEGRNGTVDGAMGFVTRGPNDRRSIPTPADLAMRNLKYLLIHCLSYVADDPGISIEGIEFLDFPKERAMLKEQFAAIRRQSPGMKIAFHVAHSLYATNRPDQLFADSRVIDAGGKQAVYTTNPGPYFSPERRAQGWNWYIYYPTLENSCGRAMLQSVDVMMDEIGADGPFMDGFMWAYGGDYTYDRWDGHTAQIDPKTKTIVRKMGSVLLLSQDALVAFCRKIRDKGGVVIANNSIMTRTIARETYILHERECFAGPEVHLASTPMALSLPSAIRGEPDVFRDVLDKLRWGNLYAYYEEGRLTHPSVPAQMYPITFEELHAGYVKGQQRLITMHSGIYGWRGDRQLHYVYRYDSRGVPIPHAFLSTVDAAGVRTRVELAKDQCSVVTKIPVSIESAGPVNFRVDRYDGQGCDLVASGRGTATLVIRDGGFPVTAQAKYVLRVTGADARPATAGGPSLSFSLPLADETRISLTLVPATPARNAGVSPSSPTRQ